MESQANTQWAPVGSIVDVPVDLVRPFKDQPRTHFDQAALRILADSILSEGQKTPAWLMPVEGDQIIRYELIAGERRWQACKLAGVKTLRAEIRNPESANEQYLDSVMENFGRIDCTPIESARAIQKVIVIEFGENPRRGDNVVEKLAKVFARSQKWIEQHRGLLKLHPELQALMEPSVPKDRQLNFQLAIAISNLVPEKQLSLVEEVRRRGLNTKRALAHVRSKVTDDMRITKKGRARRPSDDFQLLTRFLVSLGQEAELLLDLPRAKFEGMFQHRPQKDLDMVIAIMKRRRGQLVSLEEVLQRVSKARKEDYEARFGRKAG